MDALLKLLKDYEFLSGFIFGGGLFTLWKSFAGWSQVNLSLGIELRRCPQIKAQNELDHLVCVAKLKKGDRANLVIEKIHVLVREGNRIQASEFIDDVNIQEASRTLNITPGEEAQFSTYVLVPHSAVCKVVVTVFGRTIRKRAPLSVWRVTDFSVPEPPK